MEFDRSPFVLGLASVFAGLTAVLGIFGVVGAQPIAVAVAVPFGLTSYVMYYHGSGKLARAAVRRGERAERARRRRAAGAGPRDRAGPRTRADRRARAGAGRRRGTGSRRRAPASGPTAAEARSTLGVGTDAGESEIRSAYRDRVKEVHPDRGGDEEAFKDVTAAYDRLTE
ncbi:J domain-containing protein [Saliphagus infecundisoli]|uniref:J domain-containing protein n=1 Tax=Saliphagus infecundisoli TaxID=1849069 RepID=A0ABD5QEQ6_9EURY|nr:J domain-containing protein [Saliphagus infecundisoli]